MDGFDHYATVLQKWSSAINTITITNLAARSGQSGLRVTNLNASATKVLPATYGSLISGFAFRTSSLSTNIQIMTFQDVAISHIYLGLDASARIQIKRSGPTILATGTTPLVANVWNYIELRAIISDTVGLAEVYLNGTLEVSYYGAGTAGSPTGDTRQAGTGTIDRIIVGGGGSGSLSQDYDDLYVLDPLTGSAPTNARLGDVRVDTILPNGNGNSSVLVGSDGNSTDNYLLVDDVFPDDNTTYVESATPGDKDTYAFGNMATVSGTVYGVQLNHWSEKTDAGSRSMRSIARLSGTEVESADQVLAGSYQNFADLREAKPGGGVWTIADVNAAEFGVKVQS